MALVFVGHGGRNPGDNIAVPAGVTIKFFVDYDLNLDPTNAETVLSRQEFGAPNQEYTSGPVPNYELSPLTDDEMQADMSAARSLSGVIWTDVDTQLCTSPGACQTLPAHTCDGILGQAARAGQTEVVFLACRGVIGGKGRMDARLGKPGTDDSVVPEFDEWVDGFMARTASDPEAAAAEFDSLPEATRAMLLTYNDVRDWSEARQATSPSEPTAMLEARRFLESHGEVALADYCDQMDETQWGMVMADPALVDAYNRGVAERTRLTDKQNREDLLGDGAGGTDDPVAALVASVTQEATAIAMAVAELTGSGDDGEKVVDLATVFEQFMIDVDALQRTAEQNGRQDVYATAVNLLQQGATTATDLAVFQESPDPDNLATLTSAVELTNQWAAALQ